MGKILKGGMDGWVLLCSAAPRTQLMFNPNSRPGKRDFACVQGV